MSLNRRTGLEPNPDKCSVFSGKYLLRGGHEVRDKQVRRAARVLLDYQVAATIGHYGKDFSGLSYGRSCRQYWVLMNHVVIF